MLIDFDSSTNLAQKGDASVDVDEVAHRTVNDTPYIPSRHLTRLQGTPKYIARSVSLGKVLHHSGAYTATPMPELTEEAKNLYIKVYGEDRYNQYADKVTQVNPMAIKYAKELPNFAKDFPELLIPRRTIHGGRPREELKYVDIPFAHRPEHDVESVWWTMMSTLVRVHPANRPQEDFVPNALSSLWQHFSEHAIFANSSSLDDTRGCIMELNIRDWLKVFAPFPEMEDLAHLLHDSARHVKSEYALWDPAPPHPDHLHEAVQRLILQYLVDHKDQDVKLTGDQTRLRPVNKEVPPPGSKAVKADSRPMMKRKSQSRNSGALDAPKTKRRKGDDDDDVADAY